MVNAQMLFKLCHGDNAIQVGRACYFYGHHVAKIRLKKKPREGLLLSWVFYAHREESVV